MSIIKLNYGIGLLLSCLIVFNRTNAQINNQTCGLTVNKRDITVIIEDIESFVVYPYAPLEQAVSISLVKQHEQLVDLEPTDFLFESINTNISVIVIGRQPGRLDVTAISQPNETWIVKDLFVRITVAHSNAIIYISLIFGWIYFAAWSISFYPQIYINWKRQSVVGLNFDFIALNILGFTLYSAFNCGLYWIQAIKDQYYQRYPRGVSPVLLNDVVFGLHAIFATLITIAQCYFYVRGGQRVSKLASGLLGVYAIFIIVAIGLACGDVIEWLTFLYWCSYVKLSITIIKYVPQAVMNYHRKSTVGWSIGNILLDFTGGTLSMLQMILNAYNYGDWISIFGDPTKFGLGLFSVLFDVFFMLQHYVFYRHTRESSTTDLTKESEVSHTEEKLQNA